MRADPPSSAAPPPLRQAQTLLTWVTRGRGFTRIDADVDGWLATQPIRTGLATVFLQHTSASLLVQENADPQVLRDLERFLSRLAPDGDPIFGHVDEGPDDMPAHARSALTQTQLTIPVRDGRLALGTWQGLYLVEHRHAPHRRSAVVHVVGG